MVLSTALALVLAASPASASRWADLAGRLGIAESDLGIRPERFPTPLTLPAVERLLADPANGYDAALDWGRRLSSAPALSGPLELAAGFLGDGTRGAVPNVPCADLPEPVKRIAAAQAQVSPFTEAEKARLLASFGGVVTHAPLAAVTEADVALASRFDARAAADAAAKLARTIEAELPALRGLAPARCGAVLISGPGDDVYADLAGIELLVDVGGKNVYRTAAAANAVVIDLGSDLVFESTRPAFGSGVFGIGLLYAPNPGRKVVRAGDFSLGAGFFGAGGALLGGTVEAASGHFAQGAGAFGAGVFVVSGASATLTADMAAQGFGFTRGVGVAAVRGDGVRARCGLTHADPREGLALLSLCQGVGDGPRAQAAGGIGLALFDGAESSFEGSYFAQGAGYWHGFGGFYARGARSTAQARRYAQGAGVHAGVGMLSWDGADGRLTTWGVGPGFGWDYGVGFLDARGPRLALRSEWASARGDVDGRALARIDSEDGRVRLAELGTATFKRSAAGYALVRARGARVWSPGAAETRSGTLDVLTTPWGAARLEDGVLDPAVDLSTVAWPAREPGRDALAEAQAAARALDEAERLPPAERVSRWLSLAGAFTLDGRGPSTAVERLFSSPAATLALAAPALRVERFDEALWARIAAASAGAPAIEAAKRELSRASGPRRALLAGVLAVGPSAEAVPVAESLLRDGDWRLRRAGAGLLAASLGSEGGEEPGRLRFLEASLSLARSTFTAGSPEEAAAFAALGFKRLPDLFGVLALDPALSGADRLALLAHGDPFDTAKAAVWREYVRVLRAKAPLYEAALRKELASAGALRARAREALRRALRDPDPDARAGALAALGGVGALEDAKPLGAALADRAAVARDAAGLGLARLGAAARAELTARLSDSSPEVRRAATIACAQSADADVVALARRSFADREESVRLAAIAALGAVQGPYYESARGAAVPELRRLAERTVDPSVSASAARQLGFIAPAAH